MPSFTGGLAAGVPAAPWSSALPCAAAPPSSPAGGFPCAAAPPSPGSGIAALSWSGAACPSAPAGLLAVASFTMVMSLLAPGASPTGSPARAAVAVSPKARAAAVVKRESFDRIGHSFRMVLGGSPELARASAHGLLSSGDLGGTCRSVGGSECHRDVVLPPGQGLLFLLTLLPARPNRAGNVHFWADRGRLCGAPRALSLRSANMLQSRDE